MDEPAEPALPKQKRLRTVERVRQFWDRAARRNSAWYVSSYVGFSEDRDMDEFWRSGVTIWQDLKQRTDRFVEIGCGIGRLSRAIAAEAAKVDPFDVSEEMLTQARQANFPNIDFHLASGSSLESCEDDSAQMVLAYCVFQHLPDLDMLREYGHEMYRVAAPGGTVAFTLSKRDWRQSMQWLLRARAYVRSKLDSQAPQEVHRKEWVGIRPTDAEVRARSPLELTHVDLDGQRQLYFARKPA